MAARSQCDCEVELMHCHAAGSSSGSTVRVLSAAIAPLRCHSVSHFVFALHMPVLTPCASRPKRRDARERVCVFKGVFVVSNTRFYVQTSTAHALPMPVTPPFTTLPWQVRRILTAPAALLLFTRFMEHLAVWRSTGVFIAVIRMIVIDTLGWAVLFILFEVT